MFRRLIFIFALCAPFALAAGPNSLKLATADRKARLISLALGEKSERAVIVYGRYDRRYRYPKNEVVRLALLDIRTGTPRLLHERPINSACLGLSRVGAQFALYCKENVELYGIAGGKLEREDTLAFPRDAKRLIFADGKLYLVSKGRVSIFRNDAKEGWSIRTSNLRYRGELIGVRDGEIYSVDGKDTKRMIVRRDRLADPTVVTYPLNDFCCPGDAVFAGSLLSIHDFELQKLMIVDHNARELLKTVETDRFYNPLLLEKGRNGFRLAMIDTDGSEKLSRLELRWDGRRVSKKRKEMKTASRGGGPVEHDARRVYYMSKAGEFVVRDW